MGKDPNKPHQLGGPGKPFLNKKLPPAPKLLNFHCHGRHDNRVLDFQTNKTCLPDLNLDLTLCTPPPASAVIVEERQQDNHIN